MSQWNQNTLKQGLDTTALSTSGTVVPNATKLVGDNESVNNTAMRIVIPAKLAGEFITGKMPNGVVLVGDLPQDCMVTGCTAIITGKYDKAVTFKLGTEETADQFMTDMDASQPTKTVKEVNCSVYFNKPTQVIATVTGSGTQTVGEIAFLINYTRLSDFAYVPSN